MSNEYFRLALAPDVDVALPISSTVEVIRLKPELVCNVPGVDESLLGVTNWRGQLLWNLNLLTLLGFRKHKSAIAPSLSPVITAVVIAQKEPRRQMACVVSELKGILDISTEQIHPMPSRVSPAVRPYFAGWIKAHLPLMLLDPIAILNSPCWQASHPSTPLVPLV